MPAPSPKDSTQYAIRKSQSVGGFSPASNSKKVKTKETPSFKSKFNHTIAENEDIGPVSPDATPVTERKKAGSSSKKLGNLFKWFRNESNNSSQQTNHQNKTQNEDLYAKIKKNQALRVLERSIFAHGTDVSLQV